jgi:YebC/PmpR family DNA-binding regulatory protein
MIMGRKFEVRKAAMAKTNLAKTKLYSRYGKEIYMVAKNGGASIEANSELKHLVEKAKKDQVPADVVKRAIDKAASGTGEDWVPVRYEGFGPGGVGVIVDTLTDNVNRTVSEVRNCFTKTNSKLGVNGSVEHSFRHLSYVTVSGASEEDLLETLLEQDLGVEDIILEDETITIEGNGYDMSKIQSALENAFEGIEIIDTESGWYPLDEIELTEDDKAMFQKFMDLINEVDDVQNVYHAAKLDNE